MVEGSQGRDWDVEGSCIYMDGEEVEGGIGRLRWGMVLGMEDEG